ncbi:MAG: hypothetical protein HQ500_04090 [Flavobacteriales bacterium]|nr:hypothetical protein [Flavobacteriales bacterium]
MSQKIDISNYELHALDYIEGTLSPALHDAFEAFLLAHPDVSEEIEGLREVEALIPLEGSFDKASLKINVAATPSIDASNYESYFIHDVEETLDQDGQEELALFLDKNPALVQDHALYQKTRLASDVNVVYPEQAALKRAIPLWENARVYAYRAAAIVVLALGGMTVLNMLNDEVYIPRDQSMGYSLMEDLSPTGSEKTFAPIHERFDNDEQSTILATSAATAAPSQLEREKSPEKLPSLVPQLGVDATAAFEERDLMAYNPTISTWSSEEVYAQQEPTRGQAMNLNQLIGKRLFGLEPKNTSTTKDLIREGFVKTVDDRDALALNTSDPGDDKRSLEFMAGNFGFKRVNYK